MNRFLKILLSVVCILAFSGCEIQITGMRGKSDLERTATMEALINSLLLTIQAATPNGSQTATYTPTNTATATSTSTPTSTATNTPTYTPLSPVPLPIPCDRASLVADVSYPDYSYVTAGRSFKKTWRILNTGSCIWTTGYHLVFVAGDVMNSPAAVAIPNVVVPGQTVDVSVTMRALYTARLYQNYWKMENQYGSQFGFGINGDQFIWTKIMVSIPWYPPNPFAVTSVPTYVSPDYVYGTCGGTIPPAATIVFTATITTNGPGDVTFYWEQSDGDISWEDTLHFNSAGSQAVSNVWTVAFPAAGTLTGWSRIYIDTPNHQYFPRAYFTLACR